MFAEIVASNSAMVGQKNSVVIGEESWIHTDESNFYLIMFRKENKILRAKINKLTTRADLNELINILKKMDESLDSKLSKLRILTTLVSIL